MGKMKTLSIKIRNEWHSNYESCKKCIHFEIRGVPTFTNDGIPNGIEPEPYCPIHEETGTCVHRGDGKYD